MNTINISSMETFIEERNRLSTITQDCLRKCEEIENFKPIHNSQVEIETLKNEVKDIGIKWQNLRTRLIQKYGLTCFCLTSVEDAVKFDFGITSEIWEFWLTAKKIMQSTLRGIRLINDLIRKKKGK